MVFTGYAKKHDEEQESIDEGPESLDVQWKSDLYLYSQQPKVYVVDHFLDDLLLIFIFHL